MSDEDRVALSAIKFASAESAGAKCISAADGHNSWLEASMEQLCVPLPPWSLRAGARETIWFNPAEVNVASEGGGAAAGVGVWAGRRCRRACSRPAAGRRGGAIGPDRHGFPPFHTAARWRAAS